MAVAKFSSNQLKILDMIYNFGCVEKEQLRLVFEKPASDGEDKGLADISEEKKASFFDLTIKMFEKTHRISVVDGKYLLPPGDSVTPANMDMCSCFWVMLKICKNPGDIKNAFRLPQKPSVCYVAADMQHPVELFYCDHDDTLAFNKIREKMEMYDFQTKDSGLDTKIKCILVTRNAEMPKYLKNYKFADDLIIAIIGANGPDGKPEITLKKKPCDK